MLTKDELMNNIHIPQWGVMTGIYTLYLPDTRIVYVGKTETSFWTRLQNHHRAAKYGKNKFDIEFEHCDDFDIAYWVGIPSARGEFVSIARARLYCLDKECKMMNINQGEWHNKEYWEIRDSIKEFKDKWLPEGDLVPKAIQHYGGKV